MQNDYSFSGKRYWAVFLKMKTPLDALQTIKNATFFLVVLAGAYIENFFRGQQLVSAGHHFPRGTFILVALHIVSFGIGGLLLLRTKSRVVAVLIFFVCFATVADVVQLAISSGNMRALFTLTKGFQLLTLWCSARAVEATFKLRGRFSDAAMQTK